MKRILADVTAFGRQYLRSRVGTFFALAFPVILILLFGSIFSSSGSPKVPLAVQDMDMSAASRGFVQALNNTTLITYQAIPSDPAVNFTEYIRQHSINVALKIPRGFQTTLIQAEMGNPNAKVNVTLAGDYSQSSYGIAYSAVAAVATEFNFRIANATPVVSVAESRFTVRQFGYIDFFLPGIIGFTVLTTPMFGMTSICAEYRTRRFFKLLATTKLSKAEWLAAKVVFYVLLLFLSVAIMMLVGVVVFGMQATLTPLAGLLIVAGTFEDHPERGELEGASNDQEHREGRQPGLHPEHDDPDEHHDRDGEEQQEDVENDLRGEPFRLAELRRREELEESTRPVLRANRRHPEQRRREDREADDPGKEEIDVAELADRELGFVDRHQFGRVRDLQIERRRDRVHRRLRNAERGLSPIPREGHVHLGARVSHLGSDERRLEPGGNLEGDVDRVRPHVILEVHVRRDRLGRDQCRIVQRLDEAAGCSGGIQVF